MYTHTHTHFPLQRPEVLENTFYLIMWQFPENEHHYMCTCSVV